ncbi:MAG: hypothetical protein DRQ55_03125 [Planctomycetota bacterium]|nr:MAG: hypothetical protein DRQ55_03125 [Planctomycetota bacterium]
METRLREPDFPYLADDGDVGAAAGVACAALQRSRGLSRGLPATVTPYGRHDSLTCQLARGAQAGAPGMFDALYDRLGPSILIWARMPRHCHLRSCMEPEDLVQDVWIRATRNFDAFDPTRGSFRRWIFKIAKNLSIDLLRQFARAEGRGAPQALGGSSMRVLAAESGCDPSTWQQAARSEEVTAFLVRVSALPGDEQLLLMHCGMEDLPVAQVAVRLEISEAAAHKRWQRLRARLAEQGLPDGIIE